MLWFTMQIFYLFIILIQCDLLKKQPQSEKSCTFDNTAGLVIKFRAKILQRSPVVLLLVFNFKMLLCYVRWLCSVTSIVWDLSVTTKRKKLSRVLHLEIKWKLVGEFCIIAFNLPVASNSVISFSSQDAENELSTVFTWSARLS